MSQVSRHFNPRPPWGGRPSFTTKRRKTKYFNPRPPWGGRRSRTLSPATPSKDFNPRPPWGGRPCPLRRFFRHGAISIHALRGEGDDLKVRGAIVLDGISIHALRGEGDPSDRVRRVLRGISIHALRGEGDAAENGGGCRCIYFNPRPPWGGRHR